MSSTQKPYLVHLFLRIAWTADSSLCVSTMKPAVCVCVCVRARSRWESGFSTSTTQDSGTHRYSQKHRGEFHQRLAPLKVRHLVRARTWQLTVPKPLGISRSSRVKESSARAARTALECSGDSRRAGQGE